MTPFKCWIGNHQWSDLYRVPLRDLGDILLREECTVCSRCRRMWVRPISTDWIYGGSRFKPRTESLIPPEPEPTYTEEEADRLIGW